MTATATATADSPRVKWTFAMCLLFCVLLAIASFQLLPNSNLPIAFAAIAAVLSVVEFVCEIQEKRIRLETSRALIVKAIRIFLSLTPLLLLHILAPYAFGKAAAGEKSGLAMNDIVGKSNMASDRIRELQAADAMLEKRLNALEKRR